MSTYTLDSKTSHIFFPQTYYNQKCCMSLKEEFQLRVFKIHLVA